MTMNLPTLFQLALLACALVLPGELSAQGAADKPLEGDMVEIPAGHFLFGTNKRDEAAEALSLGNPEQKIFLKGFYLDRHAVTRKRYKTYVDDVGAIAPEDWRDSAYPEGTGDLPVVGVTWFDAANFCQWAGKALPTEKQWERAARGTEGREYPWGNEFIEGVANLSTRAGSKNSAGAVGSHPKGATPEGVHDLVGNVWEWVEDDYAAYKGSIHQSPDFGAGFKVLRGHSARDIGHFPGASYAAAMKQFARSGYRQFLHPDEVAPDVGFRCASAEKPAGMKSAFSPAAPKASAPPAGAPKSAPDFGGGDNPFAAKPNLPQSGMMVLILLSFVAGVFSFLSPCTLPILPAYFAITAQTDRARIGLMSLAFFIGLATLFVMMGASASFIGRVLRDYLFSLTTAAGVLVALFGVMTVFGKGFSGATFQGRPASSFFGFFLFGATFALGWTPCVGPILSGILLLAASDRTVTQGMALLFFYAIGLGLPLMLISTFCGHLPKDGLFWRVLRGKGWTVRLFGREVLLHTTNLASGILLILLGIALAMGMLTYINSLIPIELQIWFSEFEEKFLHLFM